MVARSIVDAIVGVISLVVRKRGRQPAVTTTAQAGELRLTLNISVEREGLPGAPGRPQAGVNKCKKLGQLGTPSRPILFRPGDPTPSEQRVHQRLPLGCGGAARAETAGGLGVTFVSILPSFLPPAARHHTTRFTCHGRQRRS